MRALYRELLVCEGARARDEGLPSLQTATIYKKTQITPACPLRCRGRCLARDRCCSLRTRPDSCLQSVTWLGLLWWPLAGRVQDAQHAHRVGTHVIDQDVIAVRYKLARTGDSPKSAKLGMVDQAACSLGKQFIKSQRGGWVVLGYVGADFPSVGCCWPCPNQFHDAAIFRRVSARHAWASASTSSADSTSPALAASIPV